MIDAKRYKLLDLQGFEKKGDAYEIIEEFYSSMNGVTTYFDKGDGLWYIVQSNVLAE